MRLPHCAPGSRHRRCPFHRRHAPDRLCGGRGHAGPRCRNLAHAVACTAPRLYGADGVCAARCPATDGQRQARPPRPAGSRCRRTRTASVCAPRRRVGNTTGRPLACAARYRTGRPSRRLLCLGRALTAGRAVGFAHAATAGRGRELGRHLRAPTSGRSGQRRDGGLDRAPASHRAESAQRAAAAFLRATAAVVPRCTRPQWRRLRARLRAATARNTRHHRVAPRTEPDRRTPRNPTDPLRDDRWTTATDDRPGR